MLVDSHFESNEDARRLAHWEEITDFGLTLGVQDKDTIFFYP